MTFRTTASTLTVSVCLAAAPHLGWPAECTDRWCSCFGDDDCAALFESGQCAVGTEVKSMMEMETLCSLETQQFVLGRCQQAPPRRNVVISAGDNAHSAEFPHLSKSCGG